MLGAYIKELQRDMKASFHQLVNYQIQSERQLDARFKLADARFTQIDTRFDTMEAHFDELSQDMQASFRQVIEYQLQTEHLVDARFATMDARFDRIESNMATKDDPTILESHILHAIKQLLTPGAALSQTVVDLQILPLQTDREM
jgi:hypothetical protein